MTIDNGLLPMDDGVLSAGGDIINVSGGGKSVVFGDYGTVTIARSDCAASSIRSARSGRRSHSRPLLRPIPSLGGDDQITVGDNDIVIGGAGDDRSSSARAARMSLIGDNGEIDYTNGIRHDRGEVDPAYGGNDIIARSAGHVRSAISRLGSAPETASSIGGVGADTIVLRRTSGNVVRSATDGMATFNDGGA